MPLLSVCLSVCLLVGDHEPITNIEALVRSAESAMKVRNTLQHLFYFIFYCFLDFMLPVATLAVETVSDQHQVEIIATTSRPFCWHFGKRTRE